MTWSFIASLMVLLPVEDPAIDVRKKLPLTYWEVDALRGGAVAVPDVRTPDAVYSCFHAR
jgi:hypothetical protein